VVDEEFCRIRRDLRSHEESIRVQISQPNFPKNPRGQDVELDLASLRQYVKVSDLLREVDGEIAASTGTPISGKHVSHAAEEEEKLRYLGVRSLADLDRLLTENRTLIVDFARHFMEILDKRRGRTTNGRFSPGIGLFYLTYVLIAQRRNKDELSQFISEFFTSHLDHEEDVQLAEDVDAAFKRCMP
jgi:putative GTP pyrophosphokinase